MKYTKTQIKKAIKHWQKILESQTLLEWGAAKLEDLRNVPYQKSMDYDRWQAAQLMLPQEEKHGKLGACQIIGTEDDPNGRKEYYVKGYYADGTMLELGPLSRKVASNYISLHRLSVNSRELDRIASDSNGGKYHGIRKIGEIAGLLNIIKLSDGFWLKGDKSDGRIGPFSSKIVARNYGKGAGFEFQTIRHNDRVDKVTHITYPTFAFMYTMRNEDCVDIVCAENKESAMKLFDFQWRVFDNTRPVRSRFASEKDLEKDLFMLRIKDIQIVQLNDGNFSEYDEIAQDLGNPSTKPSLRKFCRNPKFRYILGRDENTGRSPVTIRW